MSLYKKINFDFPPEVYSQILNYMTLRAPKDTWTSMPETSILRIYFVKGRAYLDRAIVNIMNSCLTERGLPPMYNIVTYIRNESHGRYNTCHIDVGEDCIFKSSLVFPMFNTEKMFAYWSSGEYELVDRVHHISKLKYSSLTWKSEKQIVDHHELTEPVAVCVERPHGLYTENSAPGGLFTIRLMENLSVDEIYTILKH